MLPSLIGFLPHIKNPVNILWIAAIFVASYYATATIFHTSLLPKNGALDIIPSVISFLGAAALIASLIDLLARNELSLGFVVVYYFLFIVLFAFLYSVLEWHF